MAFQVNGINMGSTKPKRKSFGIGGLLILIVIAVILIIFGGFLIQRSIQTKDWPTTAGIVTEVSRSTDSDGDTNYTPILEYKVDGKSFTTSGSGSNTPVSIGASQTVRYNPDNPSDGSVDSVAGAIFGYILPIVGIIMIIAGVVSFLSSRKRTEQINTLKSRGTKDQGIVTNLEQHMNTNNSNRNRYNNGNRMSNYSVNRNDSANQQTRVTVTAPNSTGGTTEYVSDWVSGNTMGLSNYQQQAVAMDVYIDPTNASNYFVEVDNLPQLAASRIVDMLKTASGTASQPPK